MSYYVLYCHVLLFSFTHCRRHTVASVFHCEDLFLHGSSYFTGVNCWSHPIFYGAKYSSHHISSFLPGVNCLSHQIFYGANCSSHHVVSFFTGVNGWATLLSMVLPFKPPLFLVLSWVLTVLATLFSTVLTVQATMFLAFSWVLTVLATLFRFLVLSWVLTVLATLSFFTGVNCFSHPKLVHGC